jgi:hypothetical protein
LSLQLDHVGLVTRDLVVLRQHWQRLGFAPTDIHELFRMDSESGERIALGQRSCHAVFAGSYIELSEVTSVDPSHHLASWLERGPGLDILALSSEALEQTHQQLAGAQIPLTPLAEATRFIDYGHLSGDAHFRWCMLQPSVSPEGLVCLMAHLSAERVFQSEVQQHDNGAVALEGIFISVPSAESKSTVERYRQLLGCEPSSIELGGVCFNLETGFIAVVPESEESTAAGLTLARLSGLAHFSTLVVGVKDIQQTRAVLDRNAVPFQVASPLAHAYWQSALASDPKRDTPQLASLQISESEVGGTSLMFRPARV